MKEILVIAEHREGMIREQTLNTIGFAQSVGKQYDLKVSSVILGYNIEELVKELASYVERVYYVNDERLRLYNNELYTIYLSRLIEELSPKIVMMGHTALSMDLLPGLAAKHNLPIATNCIDIRFEDEKLIIFRQMYEGKVDTITTLRKSPTYLITLRGGLEPTKKETIGDIVNVERVEKYDAKTETLDLIAPVTEDVDISKSDVVIGVGLGIGSKENIALAEDLANLLGGVIGCTRPIVDRGWLPKSRQIGFSGKTIKPKLYIAMGISGATYHVKGVERAEKIIAINKDPEAPIFNVAHYGVVGDLFEVVPKLIEKLKGSQ